MSFSLTIRHIVSASRNDVFTAWSSPQILEQWFFPGGWASGTVQEIHIEDSIPITISDGQSRAPGDDRGDLLPGESYLYSSEYMEVERPEKIVFKWRSAVIPESVVVVDFFEAGGLGTEIVLLHEGFETTDLLDLHRIAWEENLQRFDQLFGVRPLN